MVDCLLRNKADGIHHGRGRDYDGKIRKEEGKRRLMPTFGADH